MLDCGSTKTHKKWGLLSRDTQAAIDRCAKRTMSCSTEIGHHLHRIQWDGRKEEAGTCALGSLPF